MRGARGGDEPQLLSSTCNFKGELTMQRPLGCDPEYYRELKKVVNDFLNRPVWERASPEEGSRTAVPGVADGILSAEEARACCTGLVGKLGTFMIARNWEDSLSESMTGFLAFLIGPVPEELEAPLIDALALQWAALGGLSVEGILSLDVEKVLWSYAARRTQVMEMMEHHDGEEIDAAILGGCRQPHVVAEVLERLRLRLRHALERNEELTVDAACRVYVVTLISLAAIEPELLRWLAAGAEGASVSQDGVGAT